MSVNYCHSGMKFMQKGLYQWQACILQERRNLQQNNRGVDFLALIGKQGGM